MMWNKFIAFSLSKAILVALLVTLLLPAPAFAQFFTDEFAEEDVWGEDSEFVEEDPFGEDTTGFEQDYSEGGTFVDEERSPDVPISGSVSISGRRSELKMKADQEILPLNVAWGAGTGLLIGGWFALIQNGDDRSTQRAIGMGVVLGTGLGAFLGMKSLIFPGSPTAALDTPPAAPISTPSLVAAAVIPIPGGMKFDIALKF